MTATPGAGRTGLRRRFMAWFLAGNNGAMDRLFGAHKRALLGGLHGDVLELGPGAGANFGYYPADIRWTGVEPNLHNHPHLRQAAANYGVSATVLPAEAETLPLPDAAFDAVVCTLVLCSVTHPTQVLAEVLRVLRPGGAFVFLEHVAAPAGTFTRGLQNAVNPLWGALADGCHPNRDTATLLRSAGFAHVHLEAFDTPLPVVGPHIAGSARKPAD